MDIKKLSGIIFTTIGIIGFFMDTFGLFDAAANFVNSFRIFFDKLLSLNYSEISNTIEPVKSDSFSFIEAMFDMNRNKLIALGFSITGVLIFVIDAIQIKREL